MHGAYLDFERPSVKAITTRFPQVVANYCLFHLSQSAVKNVRKKGLEPIYTDGSEVKIFLRCLPALSFLPSDEVLEGFNDIARLLLDVNGPVPDAFIPQITGK